MKPVYGAVESICAALADECDLAARRAQKRHIFVGNLRAELIDAFDTNRYDGFLGAPASDNVVRYIDAIHYDAVLVAPRARDGPAAVSESGLVAVIWRGAGLKRE